jgi:hypothetical protein
MHQSRDAFVSFVRRFPPPWTVEAIEAGFKVIDARGQGIAYVYGHPDPRDASTANALTLYQDG